MTLCLRLPGGAIVSTGSGTWSALVAPADTTWTVYLVTPTTTEPLVIGYATEAKAQACLDRLWSALERGCNVVDLRGETP